MSTTIPTIEEHQRLEEENARLRQEIEWLKSFDGWMQMEYTKVQMKSIEEDYTPKQP